MEEARLDGHQHRPVVVDLCHPCQGFWFDPRESLTLTPGATLALFRVIGERVGRPEYRDADLVRCPHCRSRLRRTHDMQRSTRFEYLSCPHGHGRFISFFDFLREKDFIRPLTPKQVAELRANVGSVGCANCGAPIDLAASSSCTHCGSPLSMLDMGQAAALVAQLRQAQQRTEAGASQPVDPTLPLALERARREVDTAFAALGQDEVWLREVSSVGLVGAGLGALARLLKG